ncbi:MAG: lyase family protein, partial [bacterium]|nr:lyase family protein [bacterium]
MIERYSLPQMAKIWTLQNKFNTWLEIEIYACEAWSNIGIIPSEDVALIRANASFDVDRILELEQETNHDVVAFTRNVSEYLGSERKWVHFGLTSTDVVDTALSAQMVEAQDLVIEKLHELREIIALQATRHKYTPMMGRTHGIHAEPTTFGLKLAVWIDELDRHLIRLKRVRQTIAVGKLSGAVGTYANIDPYIEQYVCEKMGLKPAKTSTQTLQRDRHAEFITTIAIVGASLEKFATE